MFPKIGVPKNGWFKMENPIKMDDLGVSLFLETPRLPQCKVSQNGFNMFQPNSDAFGLLPDFMTEKKGRSKMSKRKKKISPRNMSRK